jgi:hypothetical protein
MAHRKTKQHTVNVVKAQFCAPENISYLDLFEGFNELYTINIATNIDFLANLLELFTKVEIIFGNLALVPSTLENTFAMQRNTLQELYKTEHYTNFKEKYTQGNLNIYLADAPLYPEKLFCLKNTQTGATRVILGSNNLDQLPANSDRNQALVYFDDENAFNYYMNIYNDFKQNNSEIVNENGK